MLKIWENGIDLDWHREASIQAKFIVGDVQNWQFFHDNEAQIAIYGFFVVRKLLQRNGS